MRPFLLPASMCLLALPLTSCGGAESTKDSETNKTTESARATGIDPEWLKVLDQQVADAGEIGPIPTFRPGQECPIDLDVEIAGESAEAFDQAAVTTIGDSGHRLVCSASPPHIDFIVIKMGDAEEFKLLRDSADADEEVGNVQTQKDITVGQREIRVVRTEYPTNDSHIDYDAYYFDDQAQSAVLMEIETTDTRDLITTYDEQQAAEDLAAALS